MMCISFCDLVSFIAKIGFQNPKSENCQNRLFSPSFGYFPLILVHLLYIWVKHGYMWNQMTPCFQSLKHVHGKKSHVSKTDGNKMAKNLNLPFLNGFKNSLHHLNPIFLSFPKWCITFLYLKNCQSYQLKCQFEPTLY